MKAMADQATPKQLTIALLKALAYIAFVKTAVPFVHSIASRNSGLTKLLITKALSSQQTNNKKKDKQL